MANHKFDLDKSIEGILYRIDNWINERFGWTFESIKSEYINISTFGPLLASSYVKLHVELTSPKKGLINIKNKDQTCFLWCQIRHINPAKVHSKRIVQKHKKLVNDLYYEGTELSV